MQRPRSDAAFELAALLIPLVQFEIAMLPPLVIGLVSGPFPLRDVCQAEHCIPPKLRGVIGQVLR